MSHAANRLVFLHGFLGSGRDWEPIAGKLKSPAEKHLLDLQPAADWSAGVGKVVESVENLGRNEGDAILVGYSMGARIALAAALECKIAGLVFVSGSPGLESDAERSQRLTHDTKLSGRVGRLDESAVPEFLDEWYRQPVFESLDETQIAQLVAHRQPMDCNRQSALMRTFSVANQPDFWPRIHELHGDSERQTPVLVVAGKQDSKYVDIARRFVRLCPSATLSIVANAGHNVPREQPEKFCAILDDFVM